MRMIVAGTSSVGYGVRAAKIGSNKGEARIPSLQTLYVRCRFCCVASTVVDVLRAVIARVWSVAVQELESIIVPRGRVPRCPWTGLAADLPERRRARTTRMQGERTSGYSHVWVPLTGQGCSRISIDRLHCLQRLALTMCDHRLDRHWWSGPPVCSFSRSRYRARPSF